MNTSEIEDNIHIFYKHYESLLKYYDEECNIILKLKDNNHKNSLVSVTFIRESNLNECKFNVSFLIDVNLEEYLSTIPRVTCLTDFCFPTVFDGRNLLFSIISTNWNKSATILDIVNKLPDFISRVLENEANRILVYYGNYRIDNIYQINEFLANPDINFYKLKQILKLGKKQVLRDRYIILTDVYFLLLDPVITSKQFGKLLFWGDIRQLNNAKGSVDYHNHLIIDWKNDNKTIVSFELIFNDEDFTVKDFLNLVANKIVRLKENFKLFHNDILSNNGNNENEGLYENIEYDKLVMLIKYKEELLDKNCSANIIRDLINLYQKIIEVLTDKNDNSYEIYLEKMKNMLHKEEVQKSFEEKTKKYSKDYSLDSDSDKDFVLSKSYYSTSIDNED